MPAQRERIRFRTFARSPFPHPQQLPQNRLVANNHRRMPGILPQPLQITVLLVRRQTPVAPDQPSVRNVRTARHIRRVKLSIRPIVNSAVATVGAVGVFVAQMPCRVAAPKSTLS